MELKVAAIRHNIEEIRVSSAPPRDDLAAPRIGGRDFVTERLRLQLPPAQAALVAAEEALKVVDIRLDQDQATPLEMTAAQSAVLQATGRLEILLGRISLREKFLAGSLTADAVERQAQILVLRHELKISEAALAVANSQLQLVRVRHRTGIVTQLDLMRMELDVLEKANEVDAKQLQLQLLERGGRGTRTDTVPRSGG
jgi:outer membrane protein TolC